MISVRKTETADVQMLSDIQKAAFMPLFEKYRDEGNPALRGKEDIERRIGSEYFACFTIFEEDEVVGGLWYKLKGTTPSGEALGDGRYYLQRVFIRPERQSKGIARQAILKAEKELADANTFLVDFPGDLIKNRRCYENAGFTDTGRRMRIQENLVLSIYEKKI